MSIRIAISGYGNLGKGVESAVLQNPDMELTAVFTRRDPATVAIRTEGVPVVSASELEAWKDKIDILILCGGSATDLPELTPEYASMFNVIDSFDTHARIPEHFANVDSAAKASGKAAVISCGWDPGMFSLNRMIATAVLPEGSNYTFWGDGVSQGHSDAVRRIEGVLDARSYTLPVPATVDEVRTGNGRKYVAGEMHTRRVFVVADKGADKAVIEEKIKTMPNYFSDYDTEVIFITADEMASEHAALPHGGFVIRTGVTGFEKEHAHVIEYSLKLDSNPEFTGSVIAAYARAVVRMNREGKTGCFTVFDIPPAYLSPLSGEELRKTLL